MTKMTELKTLKDLGIAQARVSKILLKEEAIKFFKHRFKYKGNPYKTFLDFHNITEEDLR